MYRLQSSTFLVLLNVLTCVYRKVVALKARQDSVLEK